MFNLKTHCNFSVHVRGAYDPIELLSRLTAAVPPKPVGRREDWIREKLNRIELAIWYQHYPARSHSLSSSRSQRERRDHGNETAPINEYLMKTHDPMMSCQEILRHTFGHGC